MKGLTFIVVLSIICMFCNVSFAGGIEVPKLERRVMDTANVIGQDGVNNLTNVLKQIEKQGIQMAILTVSSLNGESIEDFSRRVVREWKLGDKGKDNGLLITISKGDRKWRVETGRGIQGVLTDGVTSSIMKSKFVPYAKGGDFASGLINATNEMSRIYVTSLTPVTSKLTVTITNTTQQTESKFPFLWFLFGSSVIIGGVGIYMKGKKDEEERIKQIENERYRKELRRDFGFISLPTIMTTTISRPRESRVEKKEEKSIYIAPIPVSSYHRDEDDDNSSRHSSSSDSYDSGGLSDSGFSGGGGSFDGGGSSGEF